MPAVVALDDIKIGTDFEWFRAKVASDQPILSGKFPENR